MTAIERLALDLTSVVERVQALAADPVSMFLVSHRVPIETLTNVSGTAGRPRDSSAGCSAGGGWAWSSTTRTR